MGNRTRDLPACSIMPQPTTLLFAPLQTNILDVNSRILCKEYSENLNQ
jgi:hypothetical protein